MSLKAPAEEPQPVTVPGRGRGSRAGRGGRGGRGGGRGEGAQDVDPDAEADPERKPEGAQGVSSLAQLPNGLPSATP